ncbi:HlyD family secretion protein [Reyranella sp.]|uniref:HlyD family secretion protein n=1 Tax=Reyranella sp. TaxID=1929291 RepID=UPI003BAD864B
MPRAPAFTLLIVAGLAVVFAVGGFLLVRGAVPRIETAAGYLEPAGGVARVRAPRQGIVSAIHVKDGQLVGRGDAIVTLQSDHATTSGASAEAEIARQLDSQRQDLELQIARDRDWRLSEERRLQTTIDELAGDIAMLARSVAVQEEQSKLAQRYADRIRDLAAKGTISADELQRREMSALGQRVSLQATEREIAAKRAQLALSRIALEQLPMIANDRHRGLREALANVQQRLIELEARRATVVRAPVAGRIAAIPALAGAGVDSGMLIATIVPEGAALRARLFVPTRAIGKVHAGQDVAIRYDAFPYQKYGTFKGRIEEVANSVLLPREIERISPVRMAEPAYVLDVAIERQQVAVGGDREAHLRPDMLLSATIQVDRRPILAWVGESVFGVAQR